MLLIRQQQMDVFRAQPRLRFEAAMATYLRRYFPFEAANADLERWVGVGLDRTACAGFLTAQESALYLALMAMLGSGFEQDSLIPWAGEINSAPNEPSIDRITRVYEKTISFLDATGGPKCAWLVRAKLRVRKQDVSVLDEGVHPGVLAGKVRELLTGLYPQKAAVIGDRAMKDLASVAIERTRARGAMTARAAMIQAIHMFFLGSAYDRDPCYPWAEATLANEDCGPIEQRYYRMHQLSLEYLDRSFLFGRSKGQ
jgi:hypothetical protein